ncbi:DHA2 family efflux MFS transporter permease subunit [Propionicicella superfundia]|uniref:DHA2 family efflux MFS transporter permease subunit n=1 Tax=Propionicicella superfundia TaxID=348582 RepID=UPI00041F4F3B|nr:DHA2 family efflux MFS transporter permease subunit [Propionicicella superfundia]
MDAADENVDTGAAARRRTDAPATDRPPVEAAGSGLSTAPADPRLDRPWPALWALVVGFFMIMVDSTIVTIALPRIRADLDTDLTGVMWVTSAYLLAYVVPLLITGRLGDRFGPKNLYIIGLVVFTIASLACGLSDSIEALIASRTVQGLGAACISPQTMTAITRMFPGRSRGPAMSLWGATAGVATLVGPILGGLLTDSLGWEWIFFVNLPVGVIGVLVALRYVPRFPVHDHRMDWLGVALSSVAMLVLVFGIQEGERYDWGVIVDRVTILGRQTPVQISVWGLVAAGVVLLAGFVIWEILNHDEPLIPMSLFRDRNFSISSVAVAAQSFAITAVMLPVILYLQTARELSPTWAALVLAPSAIMSVIMARPVGQLVQRVDPKWLALTGFALSILAALVMYLTIHSDTPYALLLLASALNGAGGSMVWSPLSLLATYRLPPEQTGAGSGVYNTTRQVGAVLGSAAITAAMESRIAAHLGDGAAAADASQSSALPEFLAEPFSRAMAEAVLMPTVAMAIGLVLTLFFAPLPPATKPGRTDG